MGKEGTVRHRQSNECRILWSHYEETRELPGVGSNARNNAREPVAYVGHTVVPVVKVDRKIRWHYTTTILRLRIGARLTRYRNCKFHNFARTISRYSVPPSAGPLLPLGCSTIAKYQ